MVGKTKKQTDFSPIFWAKARTVLGYIFSGINAGAILSCATNSKVRG